MQRKNETDGPSVGSFPGKCAPHFPEKQRVGFGLGAAPTATPFLKIYVPIQVLIRDRNPNRTEIHSCTYCMACETNSIRTGMHENQATESAHPARPLNVNQGGVQKHVLHLRFCTYTTCFSFLSSICFALRFCTCIFCAFMISIFLHCFSVLVFCLNFKIYLFVLHAAFHQNANFPR